MKIVSLYFLPALIALIAFLSLRQKIDDTFFHDAQKAEIPFSYNQYYPDLTTEPYIEYSLLSGSEKGGIIYMFGSSELSVRNDALPFNFIYKHFKNAVIGIGHAGNQSFSIYSQLLANEDKLEGAPIFIILSPGWFANKGTNSECFLEYNSPAMMQRILNKKENDDFKKYQMKRVGELYPEFVNPDVNLRIMFLEDKANKSVAHRWFLSPLIHFDLFLQNTKKDLFFNLGNNIPFYKNVLRDDHNILPWDSLFAASKKEQEAKVTNNSWGINDEYYSANIQGKTTEMKIDQEDNTEYEDMKMLIRLLKEKKANASFMILPVNPFYYSNAKELTPFISKINNEVVSNGFPCLNMWNDDTATFDKPILDDVMHLSAYGFYKVDQFLVHTYKLTK